MSTPAVIIQARMSSSRLPGKVLRPLGGRATLAHVVRRAQAFGAAMVCTSTDASDDAIASWCDAAGVVCVRGSLDDVFARFRATLADPRAPTGEHFVRVTADCPLVSPTLAELALRTAREGGFDYVAFDAKELPRGLAVEVVRRDAFAAIEHDGLDAYEREHVTPRFYNGRGDYRRRYLAPPAGFAHPELRLTLDYPEDAEVLDAVLGSAPEMSAEEAIAYLRARPELAARNASMSQKTTN